MNFASVLFVLGSWLMFQDNGSINVQAGKQLPQSVTVHAGAGENAESVTIHYMLFVPEGYDSSDKKWPMMLFLHGLGECGDNELDRVKVHGPPSFVDSRPDFPFVVVTPQCLPPPGQLKDVPTAWKADQLIQLVDHVTNKLKIDRTRVYCTGLSMGGFGTFRLVAAYPDRFAAALPICGGGEFDSMACSLRRVPIWAFHGAKDAVVPLSKSEEMVDAVRRVGGNVRFTVYPDVEHNSWKPTYDNPKVYEWLLSHRGPLE
jgi:predicted peptidase